MDAQILELLEGKTLRSILRRCLRKQPSQRPSAASVLEVLQRIDPTD